MTITIQPTRQARRVHLSHLATTHRAPLVPRGTDGARATHGARATSFTPMARDPFTAPATRPQFQHHEA
ncbi:hypothetical protein GCM10023258_29170 [Terrabacter aeriphilus]|uniref:Uncharacterized protein n=1 Tax=Terrabacter aeriphilus TaxID=515662 RepID=A0ABP9JJN8_9MICO